MCKGEDAQARTHRELGGDGVFRFSVVIEDPHDLCAELEQSPAHAP